MKIPVMFYVAVTTLVLIVVTIMVFMDMLFNLVFYFTFLGQVIVALMVYKVLTDNFKTEKTFRDFYKDHPIGDRPFN